MKVNSDIKILVSETPSSLAVLSPSLWDSDSYRDRMGGFRGRTALIFLVPFIFFSFTIKHPFYLSVTDLKYDAKTKTLQTSVKLFTNDLEEALKKIYKRPVDLINGTDKEGINKLLLDYVQKHLSVKIGGKVQKFDFVGFEREEEAVWIYLECKNCPAPKKVEIENTLLYDYIRGQISIVNFEVNGLKKSSKATNPEKKIFFEL